MTKGKTPQWQKNQKSGISKTATANQKAVTTPDLALSSPLHK
jgi:hypothetical protein